MNDCDVLIIGAGASGLMAAYELSKAGLQVIILEARPRIGGRIWTNHDAAFSKPVEAGAEFIHGNPELTLQLLKQFEIKYHEVKGSIRQSQHGQWQKQNDFIEYAKLLDKPLENLKQDMTVEEFLNTLPDDEKHEELKYSVKKFVEGYDAADASRASALAFRDEWMAEDPEQYRIDEGYSSLINILANECKMNGCRINLSAQAKDVAWKKNHVEVTTASKEQYSANRIIITVPLGILQLKEEDKNALRFTPSLPDKKEAAEQMGFGSVIKIILEFREAFWKEKETKEITGENLNDMGFLFTDTRIPTWWTQLPNERPLLTGWIGGPEAEQLKNLSDEEILNEALNALAFVFQTSKDSLRENLKAWHVANWGADPFAHGAYSYVTVHSTAAKKVLSEPIKETLFFAGEACYTGTEVATVEAALGSGKEVAAKVLHSIRS
jgi:monoamine oxidase